MSSPPPWSQQVRPARRRPRSAPRRPAARRRRELVWSLWAPQMWSPPAGRAPLPWRAGRRRCGRCRCAATAEDAADHQQPDHHTGTDQERLAGPAARPRGDGCRRDRRWRRVCSGRHVGEGDGHLDAAGPVPDAGLGPQPLPAARRIGDERAVALRHERRQLTDRPPVEPDPDPRLPGVPAVRDRGDVELDRDVAATAVGPWCVPLERGLVEFLPRHDDVVVGCEEGQPTGRVLDHQMQASCEMRWGHPQFAPCCRTLRRHRVS